MREVSVSKSYNSYVVVSRLIGLEYHGTYFGASVEYSSGSTDIRKA